MASPSTGSAPFRTVSRLASETPPSSSRGAWRTTCPNAKFGARVMVPPNALIARSQLAGSLMKSAVGISSSGVRL